MLPLPRWTPSSSNCSKAQRSHRKQSPLLPKINSQPISSTLSCSICCLAIFKPSTPPKRTLSAVEVWNLMSYREISRSRPFQESSTVSRTPATPRCHRSSRSRNPRWRATSSRPFKMVCWRPKLTNSNKPSSSSTFLSIQSGHLPCASQWGHCISSKKYLNTGGQAVAYRSVTVMCIFSRNGSQMIMSAPLGKVVTACWGNLDAGLDVALPLSSSCHFGKILFVFVGVFVRKIRVLVVIAGEAFL